MKKSFGKYLFGTVAIVLVSMWTIGQLLLLSDAATKKSAVHTLTTSTVSVAQPAEVATGKESAKRSEKDPVSGISDKASITKALPVALPEEFRVSPIDPARVSSTPTKSTIAVTFLVEHATTTFNIAKDSTAFDLMMAASSSKVITFTGKEYSGLGTLITSINGKASNQDHNDLYWIYSVNGKKATVGVSQYVLHEGDIVSWSYEPSTM